MGKLLRSAVVVGVLVYLAPLRTEAPAEKVNLPRPSSAGAALSGAAQNLWQALPDTARQTVTEEAKRQILNEVSNNLLPETGKDPGPGKGNQLPKTPHKRSDVK